MEDSETSGYVVLGNLMETAVATKEWLSLSLGDEAGLRSNSRMDRLLHQPSRGDLQEELRMLTDEERRNYPEKVVLKPLRLVLRWFEKMEAKPMSEGAASPSGVKQRLYTSPYEQLAAVCKHLRKSPFYRQILVGIVFSIGFFLIRFPHADHCWQFDEFR